MKVRFTITELTARDVTLTVALVEQDKHVRYEITGPRYIARLGQCGCDLPGCAGEGVWRRQCKEFASPASKYAHGQQACHGSGHGGYHEEHAVALARAVLGSYRVRKCHPKALTGSARIDPNRPRTYRQFVGLDGEETVELYALKNRSTGPGESETVAARLVCSSRRCVVDGKSWRRLVVNLPGSVYDFKDDPARYPDPRIEGRNPFEVRNEHIAWHRENFPVHPRVALDRWIHDHAMVSAPEPAQYEEWGGAKFDQALAIARAEQAAEKAGSQ